ncbi:MAG: aldo/keto reductase, partial [Candidatus Binatota bacterium]
APERAGQIEHHLRLDVRDDGAHGGSLRDVGFMDPHRVLNRLKAEPVSARELEKVERLRFLVRGPVKSLAQAALAFCLGDPAVSVAIPGARNARQMQENAAAADIHLSPEDLRRVEELWRNGFRA